MTLLPCQSTERESTGMYHHPTEFDLQRLPPQRPLPLLPANLKKRRVEMLFNALRRIHALTQSHIANRPMQPSWPTIRAVMSALHPPPRCRQVPAFSPRSFGKETCRRIVNRWLQVPFTCLGSVPAAERWSFRTEEWGCIPCTTLRSTQTGLQHTR